MSAERSTYDDPEHDPTPPNAHNHSPFPNAQALPRRPNTGRSKKSQMRTEATPNGDERNQLESDEGLHHYRAGLGFILDAGEEGWELQRMSTEDARFGVRWHVTNNCARGH